jgi:hypothetical protein
MDTLVARVLASGWATDAPGAVDEAEVVSATAKPIRSIDSAAQLVATQSTLGDISLGALRDGRLRVCAGLRVRFQREDTHVIAEAVEVEEFGFGPNPSEALADLQRSIGELYLTVEAERERLGPDLARVWEVLKAKIQRRS